MRVEKPPVALFLRLMGALSLVALLLVIENHQVTAWRATTPPVNVTYFGGSGHEYAFSTVIDTSGNHYVVGEFASNNVDFDPGVGTTTLSSNGFEDIYISKFNSDGDFLWVRRIGSTGSDRARSISMDASGNLYIGGRFQSTVDFDPGVGSTTLTTDNLDAFILKLDSDGGFLWVKQITGQTISDFENVMSVTVSSTGLYAMGEITGTTDFDPGAGTSNLVSNGGSDVFALKLDLNGNFQWVKSFGDVGNDLARSLAVDSSGVYVTGGFRGTVNFNSAGSANLSTPDVNSLEGFLVKLDDNGAYQWAYKVGGLGSGVALDTAAGYVHSTGYFVGTVDFNPGAGIANLTSVGTSSDAYLLTLNADGTYVRAIRFGSSGLEEGRNLAVDTTGNVFATGVFTTGTNSPVDFDPGAASANLLATSTDAYAVKLTRAGTFVWARQFGGSGGGGSLGPGENIWAITADGAGNAIATGSWAGNMDMNTSTATSPTVNSSGGVNHDAYVAKLRSTDGYTDTTPPTGSLQNKTIRSDTRSYGHTISEEGWFYLVRDSITVTDLASITSAPVDEWNDTGVTSSGSINLPVVSNGLRDGTYYGYGVDRSGNFSSRYTGSITIDSTTPIPSISITRSGSGTLTIGQTTTLTITSSEELAGMFTSFITRSAGTIGTLTRVTGTNSWTGTFTPPANSFGTATISIAAGRAVDLDNNGNEASEVLSIDYDTQTTTTVPPTTTTTVAPTTTTVPPTTVAPTTTTTVPPTTVAPAVVTSTTVASTTTTTTVTNTPYKDWTVSVSPTSVSPGEKFSLEVSVTCPNKMNNGMYLGDPTGTPLFRFEVKNSSGASSLGGYAYRGKQVLSNNNYTVTWTQAVVAPTTNGDYTLQVYSGGAAADFIYCKMQMNARTNGPKATFSVGVQATTMTSSTSTSITTTSTTIPTTTSTAIATTTTVPPLPVPPSIVERPNPLEPVALIGGKPVAAEVVQSPVSIQVSVAGVVATVGGISSGSNALALTDTGEIQVTNKERVRVSLDGLLPKSTVDVWLYTRDGDDQKYLGSFGTTENGALAEEIQIPTGDLSGSADLVISGVNDDGNEVTIGIPMQIVQVVNSNGATASILAGLLFAVGGFFIFVVLRRRRDEVGEVL